MQIEQFHVVNMIHHALVAYTLGGPECEIIL